jgi:glycosyltransferase involved in cell wall biosynthesis
MPLASEREELTALKKDLQRSGINTSIYFIPVILRKRWVSDLPLPILALVTALSVLLLLYKIARTRPNVVHCRGYMATLLAVLAKLIFKDTKVIFDPRGFWPEERVVDGSWKEKSLRFKLWKYIERRLILHSDKVIALSQPFADRIAQLAGIADCSVIFTCADVKQFDQARLLRDLKRADLGLQGKTVFVYNGGLFAWHDPALLGQMYEAIGQSFSNTKLLVITGHDKKQVGLIFENEGISPADFLIFSAKADEVPEYLATGDYGLVPLKAVSEGSAMSVVAETMIGTKVAEYLASGLPIVVNQNVGGLKPLMAQYQLGVFFDSENLSAMVESVQHVQANYFQYQRECVIVAERCFSLEHAAGSYYQIYREIMGHEGHRDSEFATPISSSTSIS